MSDQTRANVAEKVAREYFGEREPTIRIELKRIIEKAFYELLGNDESKDPPLLMQQGLIDFNVEMRSTLETIQMSLRAHKQSGAPITPRLINDMLDMIDPVLDPGVKGGVS